MALGALLSAAPEARAQQPTPLRSLLAISKTDHTLAVVDPATLKVVSRVPVGPDPHEVVASSDGRTAYVSNTGSGLFHEINVIDLVEQKALPSVDTGPLLGPHGLAFVEGKVWFTAQGAKAVARYDPAAGKVDWVVGTGQDRTHMIHVTADQKRVFTTNVGSDTVSVLENVLLPPPVTPLGYVLPGAKPQMDWVQTVIPAGKGVEGFDVAPGGRELWGANAQDGTLTVIDLAGKKVATTVDARLPGAHRLKFTPDGGRVLVVSVRTGDLAVFDAGSRREIQRKNIGHGGTMLIDAEGGRVFVSCPPDNRIDVLDLKTLEVTGRLDVGGRPDGLAWAVRR
jgi:DNA-binding beta-propeller fold protein YncE